MIKSQSDSDFGSIKDVKYPEYYDKYVEIFDGTGYEGWLSTFKETCYAEDCKCGIGWLKSLHPQPHWKPSEEQMKALADALSLAKSCGEESAFDLRTLYEQLQKIKGNEL